MKINELCILYRMLGKDAQTKPGNWKLKRVDQEKGELREAWEQVWLPSSGLSPHLLDCAGPQGSRGLSAPIARSSLFGPCSVPHFSLTPTSSSYSGRIPAESVPALSTRALITLTLQLLWSPWWCQGPALGGQPARRLV